jgi:hypothetical protein
MPHNSHSLPRPVSLSRADIFDAAFQKVAVVVGWRAGAALTPQIGN